MNWIGDKILEIITGWLKDLVNIFISLLKDVFFNSSGIGGIALEAYNLFAYLGGLLLVCICLGKVISQLVSEGEGSQEANIFHTITGSLKASVLVAILPIIVTFVMSSIVSPIGTYFVDLMGNELVDSVETLAESDSLQGALDTLMGNVVIWIFVLIVVAFFVIKMFVEQAQLMMSEILSPLVAISVVSEEYNFMENWWRDLLSHTITIIVLTLSMSLFVESLTASSDLIWGKLPSLIGTGALVVTGPSLVKSIWYSSGIGRTGTSIARSAMMTIGRR